MVHDTQKRPDVHKLVLSVKLRPPPQEKVSILRIFYWFVAGGVKPNFADKDFVDTQTFLRHVSSFKSGQSQPTLIHLNISDSAGIGDCHLKLSLDCTGDNMHHN